MAIQPTSHRSAHLKAVLLILSIASALLTWWRWPPPPPKYLVLVVLDTVRADHLSLYDYPLETTPFLDSLAPESLVFDRAKAPAPWTVPSHASLFTGLWPGQHQAQWGHTSLAGHHLTLAEWLQEYGFVTVGLSSNGFIGTWNGMDQGFQIFENYDQPFPYRTREILARLPGILDFVRDDHHPLFLFVNLLEAHLPYHVGRYGAAMGAPEGGPVTDHHVKWAINAGERRLTEGERHRHIAAYDAAIRTLDDAVRAIADLLKARDMWDQTLFVVTSDHGDGLGSHQALGHAISTWEEQLAIPLAIRLPHGLEGGRRLDNLTSTVALAPTVLDWLRVPRPEAWTELPDLFDLEPACVSFDYRSYFSDTVLQINRSKAAQYPALVAKTQHTHGLYCGSLKLSVYADGRRRLYHLDEDPEEQHPAPVPPEGPGAACAAQYEALRHAGRYTPFSHQPNSSTSSTANAETLELLRSLGYVQ